MFKVSHLAGFGAGVIGAPIGDNLLLESGDSLLLEDGVSRMQLETGAVDPFFDSVALLFANGDGTEGNTDMVDQGLGSHVLTYVNQAQMDTGIEKFSGKATLLLDGVSDYVHTPDHADFNLGSQDFTFESWAYAPATDGASRAILSQYEASTTQRAWYFRLLSSNNQPQMWFSPDGTTSGEFFLTATITIAADTWAYVVFQREDDDWTIWINGNREAGPTTQAFTVHNGTGVVRIGALESGGISNEFESNIGPSRLTVGVARYPGAPATIEVPDKPFPER